MVTMLYYQKHSGSLRCTDDPKLLGYNVVLSEAQKIYKTTEEPKLVGYNVILSEAQRICKMYRRPKATGL